MSDIVKRGLTGAGFVIVMVGATLLGKWTFLALMALVNILGLIEYSRIFKKKEYAPFPAAMLIIGFCVFITVAYVIYNLGYTGSGKYLFLVLPFLLSFLIVELYNKRPSPFERAGISVLGIVYISLPLAVFPAIGLLDGDFDPVKIIGCFILIWSNDTFAYLSGRMMGKTPLFPSVSPKKTWEGSLGGAVCAMAISVLLHYFWPQLSLFEWLGMAFIFVLFGSWGDLVESRLKRSFDIKDSGNLLPGHGGVLDRFDAQLFSVPFAAAFLWLVH